MRKYTAFKKLNVGDVVLCINPSNGLEIGKMYILVYKSPDENISVNPYNGADPISITHFTCFRKVDVINMEDEGWLTLAKDIFPNVALYDSEEKFKIYIVAYFSGRTDDSVINNNTIKRVVDYYKIYRRKQKIKLLHNE